MIADAAGVEQAPRPTQTRATPFAAAIRQIVWIAAALWYRPSPRRRASCRELARRLIEERLHEVLEVLLALEDLSSCADRRPRLLALDRLRRHHRHRRHAVQSCTAVAPPLSRSTCGDDEIAAASSAGAAPAAAPCT